MRGLLPVDLVDTLRTGLSGVESERSSNLYCGSDLIGPLRHAQLRAAGAPTLEPSLVGDVVMQTGNFWHEWFGRRLVKMRVPFMQEVSLKPWLPTGWSGTADWIFWNPEFEAFVLGDLKTTQGKSMRWLKGLKDTHHWQLSAYWYALERMGIPLAKGFAVLYLPLNDTPDAEVIEPTIIEADPIEQDLIEGVMRDRWEATEQYLVSVAANAAELRQHNTPPEVYLTQELAPPIERTQKLTWDSGKWNVTLVPHWSTKFCPYDTALCDCSTQGTTKIGFWYIDNDGGLSYTSRQGYEEIKPTIEPDAKEIRKRIG